MHFVMQCPGMPCAHDGALYTNYVGCDAIAEHRAGCAVQSTDLVQGQQDKCSAWRKAQEYNATIGFVPACNFENASRDSTCIKAMNAMPFFN
jgi:hypothetical protein